MNNFSSMTGFSSPSLATLGFPSAMHTIQGGFDQSLLASLNFGNPLPPAGGGFQPMGLGHQPIHIPDPRYQPYGSASGGGCYGGNKGGGKGKGYKGGQKARPKAKDENAINEKQLIPLKGIYDGGINFKNILQEKISRAIHRPIGPGDCTYTVIRVQGGRQCTLALPCMGADTSFTPEESNGDDKHQGQKAAAKALEALFPESYRGYIEAHASGIGSAGNPNQQNPASSSGEDGGGILQAGEPKGMLNRAVQVVVGRPIQPGDITYQTEYIGELSSFVATVKIACIDLGDGPLECNSIAERADKKGAEKSAAQVCLELHSDVFTEAMERHKNKTAKYGGGSGSWKPKGKGKGGKGWNNTGWGGYNHFADHLPEAATPGMMTMALANQAANPVPMSSGAL